MKKENHPHLKESKVINDDCGFKFSYVVDQKEGPFFSIQSAIDEAEPSTTIKVNYGLYKEN